MLTCSQTLLHVQQDLHSTQSSDDFGSRVQADNTAPEVTAVQIAAGKSLVVAEKQGTGRTPFASYVDYARAGM
jgi:hypothetical protein